MPMYSPFLKALEGKTLEIGHIPQSFGTSCRAIDLEESALDVDSPPSYCDELARPALYFSRRADSAQQT